LRALLLNVGSGKFPLGDVNVDVNPIGYGKNVVRADAHFLPFIDSCFDKVLADNVVEHLVRPDLAILEFMRVSSRFVELIVPTRWCELFNHRKEHLWVFRSAWWFHRFGLVHVSVCRWVFFFPFMWRVEILC